MNSGNLPPDLLESTLFGHVKGAFTGAVYPKKGLFDLADKGSIFFDEIGNISVETQAKLLRVMQEREFMRLGGMETIKVDVRIIAATNVDLKQEMEDGRFREDLFYRLHVISIHLPPLRDRKSDIPLLVQHFLEKYAEENERPVLEVLPETIDVLMDYDWPGNVRELENVIERGVVLTPGRVLRPDMIPENVRRCPPHGHPASRAAGRGHFAEGRHGRLRAAVDRVGPRGGGRRAEARRRVAAHQADDAERDDQALRHSPPAEKSRQRRRRGAGRRRRDARADRVRRRLTRWWCAAPAPAAAEPQPGGRGIFLLLTFASPWRDVPPQSGTAPETTEDRQSRRCSESAVRRRHIHPAAASC